MQNNQVQDKPKVYNNYIIIFMNNLNELPPNLKEMIKNQSFVPMFQPLKESLPINIFLSKKRGVPENSIVIKEEEMNKSDPEVNDNKKSSNGVENKLDKNSTLIFEKPDKNSNKKKVFGRKPNSLVEKGIKGLHTKYSEDNILRKIKVKFFNKFIKYLNSIVVKYKEFYNINPLFNVEPEIHQNNTINFNKTLLNSKLKDIFLNFEINGKYKKISKDYNKNIINSIYENKITELINILEMRFLEVFKIFREKKETENMKGLPKLDEIIQEIKTKENDDDYIIKFIDAANNFEKYYFNKNARK